MHGGDEAAFSAFFDAYYPRLYRFAIVIGIRKIDTWRALAFSWNSESRHKES